MLKTKIYGAVAARLIILMVMFIGLVVFFPLYVICLIGEWYLTSVGAYVEQTKTVISNYDKQLNP